MVHKIISVFQIDEQVAMSQTIFMFVVQCEIVLRSIVNGIHILIAASLFTSIFDGLTIIYDGFDVNSPNISEFGRSSGSNSNNSNESIMSERCWNGNFLFNCCS